MNILRPHWRTLLAGCTVGILLMMLPQGIGRIGDRLAYDAVGPVNVDSPLYMAVGRGVLNGIPPYAGLYENKPPGIFLVAAASLALTGDSIAGSWLQLLMLAITACCVIFVSVRWRRRHPVPWIMPLCGLCFALLLAFYMSLRSGGFQTEPFGAAFASLYLMLFAVTGDRVMNNRTKMAAAFFIATAVFFKEPFALVILGSVLPLTQSRRVFLHNAVIPAALGVCVFLASLWITGAFSSYFTVYLNEMISNHITIKGSLYDRIFEFQRLVKDLRKASPMFAVAMVTLFLSAVAAAARSPVHAGWRAVSLFSALFLTMVAVAAGGNFFNHHFIFAVPFYISLFLYFVLDGGTNLGKRGGRLATFAVTLLLVMAVHALPDRNYQPNLQSNQRRVNDAKSDALDIDRILADCSLSRYLFLGANDIHPYGYTVHSPEGPHFYQYNYFFDGRRPIFELSFLQSLSRSDLIVRSNKVRLGRLAMTADLVMASDFTTEPWPCAGNTSLRGAYTVYFRKNGDHRTGLAMSVNQH